MRNACLWAILLVAVFCIILPSFADGPVVSSAGKWYATTGVTGCKECDDNGPDPAILDALYKESRTSIIFTSLNWGDCEKADPGNAPAKYDFSSFDNDKNRQVPKLKVCWLGLWNGWGDELKKKDPDRYWMLVERFITAAVKHANSKGVTYFAVPGNEFDLLGRGDWAQIYCEPLKHIYKATKAVNKNNMVMAGNLSNGLENAVQSFYDGGAKGNFDILCLHTYSNDPNTGVDIIQVVTAHRVMERNGDANKQIWLGEGWGPARELPTVHREKDTDPITQQEIDDMRFFVLNGYRNMLTKRDVFNPDWILGASFFTFNDNYGQGQWKPRVKYVDENKDGKIDYLMLDGYKFPPDFNVDPKFFNGGLVGFDGKPKADLLDIFPGTGYVPVHKIFGKLTGNKPGSPYTVGNPYTLTFRLMNLSGKEMQIQKTGVSHRSLQWRNYQISAKLISDMPKSIAPGESAIAKYAVTLPKEAANDEVVLMSRVYYSIGDHKYLTDAWTTVKLAPQVQLSISPKTIILNGNPPATQVTIDVTNNMTSNLTGNVELKATAPVKASATQFPVKIGAGQSSSITFSVSAPAKTAPGQYPFGIDVSTYMKVSQLSTTGTYEWKPEKMSLANVNTYAGIPYVVKKAPAKITVDGKLGDWSKAAFFPVKNTTGEQIGSACFLYDNSGLYFAFENNDATHFQHYPTTEIWREDSIQLAFDPLMDGSRAGKGGYRSDDYEYAFGGTDQGPIITTSKVAAGKAVGVIKTIPFSFALSNGKSIYEIKLPWSEVYPFAYGKSNMLPVALLVNQNDGKGRTTVEWGGGIVTNGKEKNPGEFIPLLLSK